MTRTQETGYQGEETASSYLLSRGYEVLERNTRFGRYEIDIIARDNQENMIVFVEVKTRSRTDERYPIRTSMTPKKRAALRRAIDLWIEAHAYEESARIDLLTVSQGKVLEHFYDLGSDFY